jgi:large subunit ribosomal protein L44
MYTFLMNLPTLPNRLLASTGVQSLSPIFNIGLFLTSALKLSEGHGSSKKMAEHRAAVNALHSFFLVRDTPSPSSSSSPSIARTPALPTSAHADFPIDLESLVWIEGELYEGKSWGGRESNTESSKRLGRDSRSRTRMDDRVRPKKVEEEDYEQETTEETQEVEA